MEISIEDFPNWLKESGYFSSVSNSLHNSYGTMVIPNVRRLKQFSYIDYFEDFQDIIENCIVLRNDFPKSVYEYSKLNKEICVEHLLTLIDQSADVRDLISDIISDINSEDDLRLALKYISDVDFLTLNENIRKNINYYPQVSREYDEGSDFHALHNNVLYYRIESEINTRNDQQNNLIHELTIFISLNNMPFLTVNSEFDLNTYKFDDLADSIKNQITYNDILLYQGIDRINLTYDEDVDVISLSDLSLHGNICVNDKNRQQIINYLLEIDKNIKEFFT